MYNKTVGDWLLETKDDLVQVFMAQWTHILTTVLFLFAISQGRRFWMTVMHCFMFVEGCVIFVNPDIFGFGESLDATHVQIMRVTSIAMVCWCLCYWLLSKSSDSTTQTSLVMAFTVMMGAVLMSQGYLITHATKKSSLNIERLRSFFYPSLLTAVGTAFHAINSKDWGGYGELSSHSNLHTRVSMVLLMTYGVTLYSMPQWVLRVMLNVEKIDSGHAYLARGAASIVIGMALMAGRAVNFLRTSDKEAVLLSQWIYFVSVSVFYWYNLLTSGEFAKETWGFIAVHVVSTIVCIMNATGALDIDASVFNRILVSRVKAIPDDIMSLVKRNKYA